MSSSVYNMPFCCNALRAGADSKARNPLSGLLSFFANRAAWAIAAFIIDVSATAGPGCFIGAWHTCYFGLTGI